jgi:hypothetical protein
MTAFATVNADWVTATADLEDTRVAGYRNWPLSDGTLTNAFLQFTVNYGDTPSLTIILQSSTYNGVPNLSLLTAEQVGEAAAMIQIYEDWFDGTITDLPTDP